MTRTVPLYQVDAFATEIFSGNPAAVCPTETWLADEVMQALAAENNLSETAFVVPGGAGGADYGLRWFTPEAEVDLCGHATLATAWVLFNEVGVAKDVLTFATRSGALSVTRGEGGLLTMDFPQTKVMPAPHPDHLPKALGGPALEYWRAKNGMHLAVLADADKVRELKPNLNAVYQLGGFGLLVTAEGGGAHDGDVDFVSRFFSPQYGVPEDPVTGAAHTVLAPYWARRLKKETFLARQVSARGGEVACELVDGRVKLSGRAVLYLKGEIYVPGAPGGGGA